MRKGTKLSRIKEGREVLGGKGNGKERRTAKEGGDERDANERL